MSLASVRALRLAGAAVIVSGGLIVASCGGGTSNYTPIPQATASSAPATQSIPTSGGTLNLPTAGTQVPSIALAAGAPAGVSITAQSSTTAPANAPTITSLKRVVQSGITGAVPFFYVEFTVSGGALSSQFLTSESINLTTSDPTTAQYGAAFDDITSTPGTELGAAGPGTIANGVVTITNTNTSGTVPIFQTGHTYLIQFFYVPASASPSPSASASASASASPSASPSSSASSSPSPAPSSSPSASPSSSPSAAPSSSPSASPSSGPTALPNYTFSGGTDDTSICTPTSCSVPVEITPVTGSSINFYATFNDPSTTTDVTIATATGISQISGSPTFPIYTGSGTPVLYLKITASNSVVFPQTPQIQVQGVTGSYSGCIFYGYDNNSGSAYVWTPTIPATGSAQFLSGGVTFNPAALTNGVDITTTPFYAAIVCQ